MKDIPSKVVYVMGAEAGFIVGMSIMLYYTLRTVRKVTVDNRWGDLNKIDERTIQWQNMRRSRLAPASNSLTHLTAHGARSMQQ